MKTDLILCVNTKGEDRNRNNNIIGERLKNCISKPERKKLLVLCKQSAVDIENYVNFHKNKIFRIFS